MKPKWKMKNQKRIQSLGSLRLTHAYIIFNLISIFLSNFLALQLFALFSLLFTRVKRRLDHISRAGNPKCLSIFLIISLSSMMDIIFIEPRQLGQTRISGTACCCFTIGMRWNLYGSKAMPAILKMNVATAWRWVPPTKRIRRRMRYMRR